MKQLAANLTEIEQSVLDWITTDRVEASLIELTSIPSSNPPGEEQAVSQHVAARLSACHCRVSSQQVDDTRANVIAILGQGHRRFIFNTHMDVVPAEQWEHGDPFTPVIQDGVLFARGSADAKGSLAAMMIAMEALSQSGLRLGGEVALTAVVDEEGCSAGSKRLFRDFNGTWGIVGEPTSLQIKIAQRGSLRCYIVVDGIGCHSAAPNQGINAVYQSVPVIERLEQLASELGERAEGLCGSPSLAVTRILAGTSDNMVPDRCEILVDRRLIPGESEDTALQEIESALEELRHAHPSLKVRIDRQIETTGGASQTDHKEPIVQLASQAVFDILGRQSELGGLPVACDMTHLVQAGIPTIILGPGDIATAHTRNEHVKIEEVADAARIYALTALRAVSFERLPVGTELVTATREREEDGGLQ